MSGPARTADVTIEVTYRITDTATEGEMLDAVLKGMRELAIGVHHQEAESKLTAVRGGVRTIRSGGHL